MKNNLGITLVSLVVTIIILLILAGVGITALIQTELFENAKEAKQITTNAQINEIKILDNYNEKINKIYSNRDTENNLKQNINVGDRVTYKNNIFKIVKKIETSIIMINIPDENTPNITLSGYQVLEQCEEKLNLACREYFVNSEKGIESDCIWNAGMTEYSNGWMTQSKDENPLPYWIRNGNIKDIGKAEIYMYYIENNEIKSERMHTWYGSTGRRTLSVCPVIICNSNIIRLDNKNNLYID